ncbi:hypothetical protein [uncultured Halomonas sp.]|uniref:hypothetical protein n=1 Tax=uncultured Halomonas sp. TaxID=173971 RepID=UPI00260975C4|nr:hypothetical protein [uncultured Halomonas sp.]
MSVNIREVMTDPALFGSQFGGESFKPWRALLSGFYGDPLEDDELRAWQEVTKRQKAPTEPHDELWMAIGRRGGKSQATALLAVYEAAFRDYSDRLSPGEMATCLVVAVDRKAARAIFRYVSGLLRSNPMLERMIVREDRESIELSNRTIIEVGTASFRSTRGMTYAFACIDEVAFLRSEDSANPDREIIDAIRPGLATLGGKLVCLSSPYARRGELWENYRRHFGQEGDILVAQAPTRVMNPSLPAKVVERAYERDEASASAEYGAQFRSDIESFVSLEDLEAVTRSSPLVRPYDNRYKYFAFVDPAGGGSDEYTMAVGHREDSVLVVDRVDAARGVPAEITARYAAILEEYRVKTINLDKYGGSWPADEFGKHGITAEHSPKVRSELYIDSLQAITSGRVELPPDGRMQHQWTALERRTSRAGRDTVDHPPSGSDDRANAAAGLIALHGQTKPFAPMSEWL